MYSYTQAYSGLPTKFKKFIQKIELTDNQRDKIKTSHKHLREKVLQPLDYVSHTFLTGSYKKKTLIKPANDIDVFVVLSGYSKDNIKPNTILDKLKNSLNPKYPQTTIKQDKPCIVIEFNHVTFELTPAIEIPNYYGGDSNFYIPEMSKNNRWQNVENPRVLEKSLTKANQRLNNKLIPLIKMMKHHNKNLRMSGKLASYEIEKIAIENLSYINDFRDGIEELLMIYKWCSIWNMKKIKEMSDDDFASLCKKLLFGSDFPKD
jgi:hypothetical protein